MIPAHNLQVQRLPIGLVLRYRDGTTWRIPRPFEVAGTPYVLVGTRQDWYPYALAPLARFAVVSEFEVDAVVPDPDPAPAVLNTLTPEALDLFVTTALGYTGDQLEDLFPDRETVERSQDEIRSAGLRLQAASVYAAHLSDALRGVADAGGGEELSTEGAEHGTIRTLTPEEFAHMKDRFKARGQRRSWPWRNMKPGDSVTFPPDEASLAQRTVHAYSTSRRGAVRFATTRHPITRVLTVVRLA